ncbi:MAG TPA: ATP-binding protein [Methylomirabilota bacterium]|nr:ATP-binding protein [Methylomirabilota bacterium]
MFFFNRLLIRIIFLVVFLFSISIGIYLTLFIQSQVRREEAAILQNGIAFSELTAPLLYEDYLTASARGFPRFQDIAKERLKKNADITQVVLIATNGKIIFDTNDFNTGAISGRTSTGKDRFIDAQQTRDFLQQTTTQSRTFFQGNERFTEIVVPITEIGGDHVFSMRYLLSYRSLEGHKFEIYRDALVTFLPLFLLTIGSGIALAISIIRPIEQLSRATEQIERGDLTVQIPVHSHDELGKLTDAFNKMATQLKQYYTQLEQKVQEKTLQLAQKVKEVEAERAKDEAILDSIGDGMIVTDEMGKIILMNIVAAQLVEVDPIVVKGKQIFEIFNLYDDRNNLIRLENRPMHVALQNGRKVTQSAAFFLKNGKKISLGLTAAPVMQQGEIIGAIETIRDITKEKEIDRMKTEFISLASHQLRTPLSAIKWFSEMLTSGDGGPLNQEQADFAKNIADSTERMIQLVNSLLNISRIESGRIIIAPQPTDLGQLVQGIIIDLKAKIEERQQAVLISFHEELPKINIDPRLIRQVYLNLLTNAIKYTPKGGEIHVFISRKNDEIISQVSDNGYGIPKHQQGKLFEKFFRGENIAKIETDGTGLGLYLTKIIIESSKGRIWFSSEEGKGTSFFFSMPTSGMEPKKGEVTLDI